jgi:hypothetical protein
MFICPPWMHAGKRCGPYPGHAEHCGFAVYAQDVHRLAVAPAHYYPAHDGKEDALILAMDLSTAKQGG